MRILAILLGLAFLSLGGCLQQGDDAGPPGETATWVSGSEFGLAVEQITLPDQVRSGAAETWVVRAVNKGPPGDNMIDYNGGCAGPFAVTVSGPDGSAVKTGGADPDCVEFPTKEIRGGETLDHEWVWDGRIWADGQGSPAPEGIYTIRFTFEGFHAGNPDHDFASWGETTVWVR